MQTFGQHGRYFVNKPEIREQNTGIDIYLGFKIGVTKFVANWGLTLDLIFNFQNPDSVLDRMRDIYKNSKNDDEYMNKAYLEIVGRKVKPSYSKRDRNYTVVDIDFDKNPANYFITRKLQGAPITDAPVKVSLLEYYLEVYKVKIKDAKQSLLKVRMPRGMRRRALEELYNPTGSSVPTEGSEEGDFKPAESPRSI